MAKATIAALMGPALLLAACGDRSPAPSADPVANAAGEIAAPTTINQAVPPIVAEPADGTTIPAPFHGRWGLVPADCTSTMGDAKGLMTVTADRLSFYESRATIAKLTTVSPTELKVTLAFTGEGQEWTDETPLVLSDDGGALTRTADGQRLRYTRCKA